MQKNDIKYGLGSNSSKSGKNWSLPLKFSRYEKTRKKVRKLVMDVFSSDNVFLASSLFLPPSSLSSSPPPPPFSAQTARQTKCGRDFQQTHCHYYIFFQFLGALRWKTIEMERNKKFERIILANSRCPLLSQKCHHYRKKRAFLPPWRDDSSPDRENKV